MRITTWNVNGLRAALRKGFAEHLALLAPDVLLLQEVRSLPEQLPERWRDPLGWNVHWHPAEKKGYSGTAIWSRYPLEIISTGIDGAPDTEGRVIHAHVGGVDLVCMYLPSGSSSEERQAVKDQWLQQAQPWMHQILQSRRPTVIGGDLNIAHTERDIFHAKSNQNTSGFLPHEREWFGALLDSGWADFVREKFGDRDGPYSWWSNRGQARVLDRGWRIDYLLGNRAAAKRCKSASIHREGGMEVSDHAPVTIEFE